MVWSRRRFVGARGLPSLCTTAEAARKFSAPDFAVDVVTRVVIEPGLPKAHAGLLNSEVQEHENYAQYLGYWTQLRSGAG